MAPLLCFARCSEAIRSFESVANPPGCSTGASERASEESASYYKDLPLECYSGSHASFISKLVCCRAEELWSKVAEPPLNNFFGVGYLALLLSGRTLMTSPELEKTRERQRRRRPVGSLTGLHPSCALSRLETDWSVGPQPVGTYWRS